MSSPVQCKRRQQEILYLCHGEKDFGLESQPSDILLKIMKTRNAQRRKMTEIKRRLGMKERKMKLMKLRKRVWRVKNKKEGDGMLSEIRLRRGGGSRAEKHRYAQRVDDSDDSLLVDEMDRGLVGSSSWMHVGNTNVGQQWVCGGLDMHNATAWGLKVAASRWGHQGDMFGYGGVGAQPIEPSSKGRADIQPLQVDETVSFDDIGGLSDHIDALKEMGANGLSKWVGEAEQQLKLLFEEAQRNQPSIIFFDEIDGLAPVRSSKQEQIHNSIVSTLLALMDGLDSRDQVVLIGATNKIDAIDGPLRRPGRFDHEFVFSLPYCKARAEILKIHTRKWKNPLSEELRMELAAACMGYSGADLKALCTEAAINAFREKYPQIYTSDDKFVIDLDSVKVEKHDFLEAMSTITPTAHRVAKGDKKDSLNDSSRHLAKLLGFPYGSSIPFVYRPRLLLCVKEGAGLDHIGSAVLHELERFPVHCLGLPSLLSDPSAWTPEEALVHIMGEARRTTPSILYLPQLQLWWETAHDQLRALLLSILEELPSDLPLLLLATSSVPSDELDGEAASLFGHRYIYQVEKPCSDDRCRFISQLVDAVLTIPDQQVVITPKKNVSNPELPKVPKAARGPSETELRAKVEAEEHAIRRL
ncbi:hypothetical protein SUGI_0169010 [Cryptomeria japonica]|nr:hypothetical protein SUGI_0169010 [Cryptomeria japonica]